MLWAKGILTCSYQTNFKVISKLGITLPSHVVKENLVAFQSTDAECNALNKERGIVFEKTHSYPS